MDFFEKKCAIFYAFAINGWESIYFAIVS